MVTFTLRRGSRVIARFTVACRDAWQIATVFCRFNGYSVESEDE